MPTTKLGRRQGKAVGTRLRWRPGQHWWPPLLCRPELCRRNYVNGGQRQLPGDTSQHRLWVLESLLPIHGSHIRVFYFCSSFYTHEIENYSENRKLLFQHERVVGHVWTIHVSEPKRRDHACQSSLFVQAPMPWFRFAVELSCELKDHKSHIS
jgi:hypothetical protein